MSPVTAPDGFWGTKVLCFPPERVLGVFADNRVPGCSPLGVFPPPLPHHPLFHPELQPGGYI